MGPQSNPGPVLLIGPRNPVLSCHGFSHLVGYPVQHSDPGPDAGAHCSFASGLFHLYSFPLSVSASRSADRAQELCLTAGTVFAIGPQVDSEARPLAQVFVVVHLDLQSPALCVSVSNAEVVTRLELRSLGLALTWPGYICFD
jgi:hypothetical protein